MINRLQLLFAVFAVLICSFGFGQISLPANSIVTENFNNIGSSATAPLPANWRMSPSGNSVGAWSSGVTTTTQAANSGLPATGGRYNWATTANTDRAIGFLTSATYNTPNAVMGYYRNTTGASVTSVTISFAVERYVVNTGTFSLSFASSTDGISWTSQTAGDIATGLFATGANAGTFSSPQTITKMVTVSITVPNNGDIYFRWVFNTSNTVSQGLGLDDVSVFAGTATPVLTAKLRDILQVDNGTPFQFNEGDVIRYQTVIKNIGTADATSVQLNEPPPSNTTLLNPYKTSALARDDNYTSSFNTLFNGTTVLGNDFGLPLPTVVQTFGPVSNPAATAVGSAGTTSAGGSLTVNANGTFTYTPPTGFTGVDQFKYVTGNGNLPNNDALVNITVSGDITITPATTDPTCNNATNGCITINAGGGNAPYTYKIDAGSYQVSNVFCGLASGLHNLFVQDAGGYVKTGTATLNNPAAITVSGTIPQLGYSTAIATITFTKTNGSGTPANPWSATGLPVGVTINSATGAVTGTPTVTGNFSATITYTDANGCTGSTVTAFSVAPKLSNDAYNVVGNTQLVADGHSTPTTPFTASATNIITNDNADVAITITAVINAATTNGGTITIAANGKFTYTPPVAVTASDSYTYTGTSNGVSATAVINFTIANKIWYVNNTYVGANGAANGTSSRPYTDVASAEGASLANDYIYVHTGSGNTTGNALLKSGQILRGAGSALSVGALSISAGTKPTLTGMITLNNNVTVDGFDMTTGVTTALTNAGTTVTGVSVNLGNITTSTGTGITITGTGNSVTITLASLTTNGAVNAVTLINTAGTITINSGSQTGSTAPTFNISGGTLSLTYSGNITQAVNAAMVSVSGGHTTGSMIFQTGTLSATNGTGLQFDNADGIYNFNGTTTLNGGDAGIDILNASAGTFIFTAGTAITNPANEAIKINASSANVTFSGSFTKTNNAVNGILVNGETGGTITINGTGTKTLSTTTANAINLTTNTGAVINFSGNNLQLTTSSGTGFNATGGGTINVMGTGNIILTGAGTALNVTSTTIGSSNLTFQSISSNGGSATGIILDGTGASNGLIVTGDGSNTSLGGNSSGGTIANKSGADGATTSGIGIYLNNTSNVILRRMTINGTNQNFGLKGNSVTGFTMEYSSITGANGTSTPSREGSVIFDNLFGSCSMLSCIVSGSVEDNIRVENTSGTLSAFNLANSTIQNNNTVSGNTGFRFATSTTGVSMTGAVTGCRFQGNRTDAINTDASNGNVNISILSDTIIAGTGGNNQGNIGIDVTVANNGVMNFAVENNKVGTDGSTNQPLLNTGINIFNGTLVTSGTPASITGTVKNNTVYNAGAGMSGFGIRLFNQGYGSMNGNVTGNTVNNVGFDYGIFAEVSSNSGSAAATGSSQIAMVNNTSNVLAGGLDAIRVQARGRSIMCARISGNISNTHGSGFFGLEIRQAAQTIPSPGGTVYQATFNLEGLSSGLQTNMATIVSYLNSKNLGIVGGCDEIHSNGITGVATNSCISIPN